MNTKSYGNWLVDLGNMTCCNTENQMIIAFEKKGAALKGKIKDMPLELSEKWAKDPDGEKHIRKAFFEADEAFFRVYFNREIEKKIS